MSQSKHENGTTGAAPTTLELRLPVAPANDVTPAPAVARDRVGPLGLSRIYWVLWAGMLLNRLGGTVFLGDYCGILMKERVTGFPFNALEHPMYVGSSMSFLGTSLWYSFRFVFAPPARSDRPAPSRRNASPAGALLSLQIYVVYMIASVYFEG